MFDGLVYASNVVEQRSLLHLITPTHHPYLVYPFMMLGLYPTDGDPNVMKAIA